MNGRAGRKTGIVGVLLVAGFSRRFGRRDKRTVRLRDGRVLACACARNLIRAVPNACAVIRPEDRMLAALLKRLGLKLIFNSSARQGLSSSIVAAVRATPLASGWIFLPADMPKISPAILRRVHKTLDQGAKIAQSCYRTTAVNPVGFNRVFRSDLLSLRGDTGARLVARRTAIVCRLPTSNRNAMIDIDAPSSPLLGGSSR